MSFEELQQLKLELLQAKERLRQAIETPSTSLSLTRIAEIIVIRRQELKEAEKRLADFLAANPVISPQVITPTPEPIPIVEPTPEPDDPIVFVNIFNSAGEIISSGPILLSNVERLRAAGQRVDIITESEVTSVPTPIVVPQNPFIRVGGEKIRTKEEQNVRIIRIVLKERLSATDRARLS